MGNEEVLVRKQGRITIVTINRPHVRNAVDRSTAQKLADTFRAFERDDESFVAILTGAGGNFCAGADLKALYAAPTDLSSSANQVSYDMNDDGPMGVSRMRLSKPVIAAISGYAVAGGFELALWCDMRVADSSAILGVFCRLRGVPLIDGGTVRLPRLIGRSAAMDLILTGRAVNAAEAHKLNLVNRVTDKSTSALDEAISLAHLLASHPQVCMRGDRQSVYEAQDDLQAMKREFEIGMKVLQSQEFRDRVGAFLRKDTKL
ncbi:hypothetical protein BZG36_04229 [Bifiguratus adelaidae]|uniref:Enoyl-CoA hydratase n=1 Tax=Bifiguratus adelaidae TaxID=1938954 RepID=A0A261XY76_9FUNG|nr:hypothetical protein BZG36_04229 [Bifiguratus adelaidae]